MNSINEIKKIINKLINKNIPITNIYYFNEIDSTNSFSKNLKLDNDEYNLVISNKQTNGRGRLGRSFYSPEDTGIYMSFVYKNNKLSNPINITSIAAVAVTNAITEIMDIDINIKWVNDLYYNNKKICGILTEATTNPDTGELDNIIVGIGLNISTTSFPNELKEIATSINLESSRKYELIARIVNNLHYFLNNDNKNEFLSIYRNKSMVIGKDIYYYSNNIKYEATAIEINDEGELVVEDKNGNINVLRTGEITLRIK